MKRFKKFGFTLTEIVIVMLIIAVVVGVTIRITKAKLDQITTYLYYGAFGTTKAVVQEMFNNYKFSDEDYIDTTSCNPAEQEPEPEDEPDPNKCKEKNGVPFADNYGCYMSSTYTMKKIYVSTCSWGGYCAWQPTACKAGNSTNKNNACTYNYYEGAKNFCKEIDMELASSEQLYPIFKDLDEKGKLAELVTYPYTSSSAYNECFVSDEPEGEATRPDGTYVNYKYYFGSRVGFGTGSNWDFDKTWELSRRAFAWFQTDFACYKEKEVVEEIEKEEVVNKNIQTIPRSGAKFCEKFGSLANTNSESCNGTAISNPATTNFADSTNIIPDIILRNGMRMYNVSQCPIKIPELNNNIDVGSFGTDSEGNEKKINEWGYVIYIDIDGKDGNGKLWEDVYPFYITLSGMVIPAYDTAHPGESGGDSKFHLQASVLDDYQDATGHHKAWYTKSSSFKESACTAGYIGQDTPYCVGGENSTTKNDNCNDSIHDCRIKYIKPIKIFGANTLD